MEIGSNSGLVECDIGSEPISFSMPLSSASEIQVEDFVCKNQKGRSLVPKSAVKQVWNDLSILSPLTIRCCKHRLNQDHRFIASDMENITAAKVGIDISSARFREWLMAISSTKDQKQTHRFSFDENGIVADDYKMLTSLTNE